MPTDPAIRAHTPPTPGLELRVVHADPRFVVVDKPSGMLSVPGRGEDKQDCARARVLAMFPAATGPMTCHRLDMDTSGLLVLAMDADAHRNLSMQFESRRVRKLYAALVQGVPGLPLGATLTIDLPHCVDWANRPIQKIDFVQGRPARTHATLRGHERWTTPDGRVIDAARVELAPETGRTHQLRVHCAAPPMVTRPDGPVQGGLGCPIIGDRLYGDPSLAPRLLLHAQRLGLHHPTDGAWLEFSSPAPF